METVVLNGARSEDKKVDEVADVLTAILGTQTAVFKLRDIPIGDCMGCFGCWVKTPGECVIKDAEKEISDKLRACDLKVFLTPVVFGGYSYELKKALDRHVCSELLPFFMPVKGETIHKPRYQRHASVIVIGVLPKPDLESETIFKALATHNALNIHASTHAVGFVYYEDASKEINQKIKDLLSKQG